MSDKTVILKVYESNINAEYDMRMLEENGIPCFITHDSVFNLTPLFDPAVGSIRLCVFEDDEERALMLLNEIHSNEEKETGDDQEN